MAVRDSGVGGHTIAGAFTGARAGRRSAPASLRGACIARMMSALRNHRSQTVQALPPARLSAISATAFAPAQTGQTKGIRTGARAGNTVSTY